MKHQLTLNVTEPGGKKNTVLTGNKVRLMGLIKLLLGQGQKVLVLVPGDTVESISVKEVEVENE